MTHFSEYKNKYKYVELQREKGVLEMHLHTEGKELRWSPFPDREVAECLWDVGRDPENLCVIITGTGSSFCDKFNMVEVHEAQKDGHRALWSGLYPHAYRLQMNHLDIEVPVIAAVNGPASIHAELALLGDIVLCSDNTFFQDKAHFSGVFVPGDGVHVVWPTLLGPNQGRYFLLTGQKIGAAEALQRGIVAEVLPASHLLDRARELARQIAARPSMLVRGARAVIVQKLRKEMLDLLPFGLATEIATAISLSSGNTNTQAPLTEEGPAPLNLTTGRP